MKPGLDNRRMAVICSGCAAAIAALALLMESVHTSRVTHALEGFVIAILLVISATAFKKSRRNALKS
jgi:hypothetical protein